MLFPELCLFIHQSRQMAEMFVQLEDLGSNRLLRIFTHPICLPTGPPHDITPTGPFRVPFRRAGGLRHAGGHARVSRAHSKHHSTGHPPLARFGDSKTSMDCRDRSVLLGSQWHAVEDGRRRSGARWSGSQMGTEVRGGWRASSGLSGGKVVSF